MRRAMMNEEFVEYTEKDGSKTFLGVNLGFDFCAEHEWGISGLKDSLGIWNGTPETEKKVYGMARSKINNNSSVFFFSKEFHKSNKEFVTIYFLGSSEYFNKERNEEFADFHKSDIEYYILSGDKELLTYWDSSSFLIISDQKDEMIKLNSAFLTNEIGLRSFSRSMVFSPDMKAGLMLFIMSELSDDVDSWIIEDQKEYYNMFKKFRRYNLEKKFKKAKIRYDVLYPMQIEEGQEELVSKFPYWVWWWPVDTDKYEGGSYTIEDFQQLLRKGSGPLLKEIKVG